MAVISIPFTFSAGASIIASQHNSNFSTIANLVNGSIDTTNLSASAGILYSQLVLGGNIVNADINAAAAIATSKVNFGSNHQGDVFVDTGSGITRLTPGSNGQFLQTQGASANPQWATVTSPPSVLSNVLFQYSGSVDAPEELSNAANTSTTAGSGYRYFVNLNTSSSYDTILASKFTKILGISTVTVYVRLWCKGGLSGAGARITIDSLGALTLTASTSSTPTWYSGTIDVSSLTNGTTYDVTVGLGSSGGSSSGNFCGNVIAFGS